MVYGQEGLGFTTGNDIFDDWKHFKKIYLEGSEDLEDLPGSQQFTKFVKATVETLQIIILNECKCKPQIILFDFPYGVTLGQVCAVTGKYLEDHPERLHEFAIISIINALNKAWPAKKK